MRIVLAIAVALLAAGPVGATELEDFEKRVKKLESSFEKPKPLCICMDGTELNARAGTLLVNHFHEGRLRVRALCQIPHFNGATGMKSGSYSCSTYIIVGK
jgi:hypothetical protein